MDAGRSLSATSARRTCTVRAQSAIQPTNAVSTTASASAIHAPHLLRRFFGGAAFLAIDNLHECFT